METKKERIECKITGRVQMVMYRDFATRKARAITGITGFVRNNEDGSVALVAEGERARLEKLILYVRRGPLFSNIEGVTIEWKDATDEYSSFSIVY